MGDSSNKTYFDGVVLPGADGSFTRDGQVYHFNINAGKAGASSGYTTATDKGTVLLAASTGASTWTVPISLRQGDVITSFRITGQMEAGGNANVLDADLRVVTSAAAAVSDASIGAITQISEIADYKVDDTKTGLSHTVISGNSYYVLITGTTLAANDQELQAIEVTVNQR